MSDLVKKTVTLPWQLPVPSTSFVEGPRFQPGGTSVLDWTYEADSEFVAGPTRGIIAQSLCFSGVVAYTCIYDVLCGQELITKAYDKLMDLGETKWLLDLRCVSESVHFGEGKSLKHLAIFFDQGPCYEFVCEGVSVSEKLLPTRGTG